MDIISGVTRALSQRGKRS